MHDVTVRILNTVHPDLRVRVLRVYEDIRLALGLEMRPTSGLRSMAEQQDLWRVGRDTDGNELPGARVLTRARPGSSWHNFGLAVDSCFSGKDPYWKLLAATNKAEADRRWAEFGRFCKAHGLEWGGDWNGNGVKDANDWDLPHAQCCYGMNLKQVQDLYKVGGLTGIFHKIDKILEGG